MQPLMEHVYSFVFCLWGYKPRRETRRHIDRCGFYGTRVLGWCPCRTLACLRSAGGHNSGSVCRHGHQIKQR